MTLTILTLTALLALAPVQAAPLHSDSVKEVARHFENPPQELANHVIWGWDGQMDIETIRHDLDSIKVKGFRSVIFEAGYGNPFEYLSDGWFSTVRTAVQEAKARGLKVWIIDEGKYPSGFAGGKFTRERPDLRMKALVVKDTLEVQKGRVLSGYALPEGVNCAVAVCPGRPDRTVEVKDGKISFFAGDASWTLLLGGPDFRTGQTRAVNNPTRGKDTSNSQSDYLNPEAVGKFLEWTHEKYKEYIGDEFGKTVLGFRGDEPDFSRLPWTDSLPAHFREIKGYDPLPFLGAMLGANPDPAARRFRADYHDVWSQLFARYFFGMQAEWCEANGISYVTHLNKDHDMPECIRVEGDFFRDLSRVQIPGVDAIWNQIWPGTDNDYPKFASSVSHVYGKQRAFSESFAAYNIPPTIPTARYAVDYQMVRGINFFEFMFWMAGSRGTNWMTDPRMKALNDYTGRATYLMTQGTPGARIAVYYPTSTFWLGDRSVNPDLVEMARELLRHQRDFDWVDDDAFTKALRVGAGYLENQSGQQYSTLVMPSCETISEKAWAVIEAFAREGGKVLFWGRRPAYLYGTSFRDSRPLPELRGKVTYEPVAAWSPAVASALPEPELSLDGPHPAISYAHRRFDDGDIYLLFNEGETPETFRVSLDGHGIPWSWDAENGTRSRIPADSYSADGPRTGLEITLAPWESRIISIEKAGGSYNARRYGVKGNGKVETAALQALIDRVYADGGGTVVLPRGNYLSGALFFPAGVNLHLDKGAVLKGTADLGDYPVIPTRFEGFDRAWRSAFLNFDHSRGVLLDGEGTIDGNGLAWNELRSDGSGRPRLVCFTDCPDGAVKGLKFRNQASWCLHVLYTRGFTIEGVDILAKDYIPSSDGIDIDSCSDVVIRGSFISVHDDCISIKSGKDAEGRRVGRPSEDILIENCHFGYGHGAVTMGSEVSGDVRRVVARDCRVDSDNWAPIRFKSQPPRGGIVEDITFENMEIDNVRNIFDVILEWRSNADRGKVMEYADPVTELRNVTVRNVRGRGKTMGRISGFESSPILRDVFHFENCSFETGTGLIIKNADPDLTGLEWTVSEGEKLL
ncbi:MAG: glycoside hydrolase [Bacteroidales bacterium]|nr:glycoside hydrolase [Bacteroidales bacterium]